MLKCICCRQSVQRRLELLANMAHATVPVCVKTLRRWKLLSMANTHVASVERSDLFYSSLNYFITIIIISAEIKVTVTLSQRCCRALYKLQCQMSAVTTTVTTVQSCSIHYHKFCLRLVSP